MSRKIANFAIGLLACAASYGATISTTMSVTGTVSVGATGTIALSGTASFANTNIGSGTITASLSAGASGFSGPYTITLTSGGSGTITGQLSAASTVLSGSGNVSATVTGGTGTYAGATGSFPTMPGAGAINTSTGAITLTFSGAGSITTSGGSGGGGSNPPLISNVLDAASYTTGLAPGGFFYINGTNLSPTASNVFNLPRPTTTPDGMKVTFTPAAGGAGTDAYIYYEITSGGNSQISGIVPSTLAPGKYNVTVTNGSQASAAVQVTLTASKFELFTQNQGGTGLASVQNYISQTQVDLNSFTTGTGKSTTISPAHPGQYLLAYGTGMGAVSGADNVASPSHNFLSDGVNVQVIVGGMSIPAAYAGRAGYAGEDQVNVQLPGNVPTGCAVPFQVSVNGTLSAPTFIAIAPDAGSSACVAPGFTLSQLQSLDAGTSILSGNFSIATTTISAGSLGSVTSNSASGSFTQYTAFLPPFFSYTPGLISTQTIGACTLTHSQNVSNNATIGATGVGLDAGTVTLTGPAASNIGTQTFKEDATSKGYSLSLATSGVPVGLGGTGTITAGQYSVSGAGGKDVGKFSANLTLASPLFTPAALPTTVTRSSGVTVSWTGGASSDPVTVSGGSSSTTDIWFFVCNTTAGAGGLTVPSQLTSQLPASANGLLSVADSPLPVSFSAPLTAGGSIASTFSATVSSGAQVTYQ